MDSIADLLATRPVVSEPGASGYFSEPSDHLDPNLFGHDERVHRQVRVLLLNDLYSYWRGVWSEPQSWSTVYLAGSGASYQWAADRSDGGEPGDLDVLIDIDWQHFYDHQPGGILYTPEQVAEMMDRDLKANLWPKTAELHIGRGVYEATFYVNPQPIASIRPYAAYNLSEDSWLVRPDRHPRHPQGAADYEAVLADRQNTDALVARYNEAVLVQAAHPVGSPEWATAKAILDNASVLAREMFDEIHGARSVAFSERGDGYSDDANFRWQYAKRSGVINNLMTIAARSPRPGGESIDAFLIKRAMQARQP